MKEYKSRDEIPNKYKFDLSSIIEFPNEFNKMIDSIKKNIEILSSFENIFNSNNNLYEYLTISTETSAMISLIINYRYARYLVDNNDELWKDKTANELYYSFEDLKTSFERELLSLSIDDYNNLINNKKLDLYKAKLNKIYCEKEHIPATLKEKVINNVIERNRIYNNLNNCGTVKISGVETVVNVRNFSVLSKSSDKKVRKQVYELFLSNLNNKADELAALLDEQIKYNIKKLKASKYNSLLDLVVFKTGIPYYCIENMISSVEDNIDIYHNYYKVLKKILKLNELDYYDLSLSMNSINKDYSIEEAMKMCLNAINPLGKDYLNHFKKIFDNQYIDFLPCENKNHVYYNIPMGNKDGRIVINYKNDLESISKLIHECGHHVHHQYINENNGPVYNTTNAYLSEIAAITNELLLDNYLYNNSSNNEEKITAIMSMINLITSNIFGSIRNGLMMLDLYNYVNNGNTLDKKYLNKITCKYLDKYNGKEINKNSYYGLLWARQSQFFKEDYLFTYAFSTIIALFVVSEINNDNKEIINRYIKFLSCGSDKSLIDIIKILGINIDDGKVYIKSIEYFKTIINELENY